MTELQMRVCISLRAVWVGIQFISVIGAGAKAYAADSCIEIEEASSFTADPGVFSQPAQLKDGSIAVGTVDGVLFILSPTGKMTASFRAQGGITSAPIELKNGNLAFGSGDGTLYTIRRDGTGVGKFLTRDGIFGGVSEMSDGSLVAGSYDQFIYWVGPDGKAKASTPTFGSIYARPLLMKDGAIVVGSTDKRVHILDSNGVEKAAYKTAGACFGSAVAIDDHLFAIADESGSVYFLKTDGSLIQAFQTGGPVFSAPVVLDDATVVVASNDSKIYFLGPDGNKKAVFATSATRFSGLATDGKRVAFGTNEGRIYVLNAQAQLVGTYRVDGAPWPGVMDRSGALPSEAQFASLGEAPADEYFGRARMSVLGIHSACVDLSLLMDQKPGEKASHQVEVDWVMDALRDWERRYPSDSWLPRENFALARLYEKIGTPQAFLKSSDSYSWLTARYEKTWYSQAAADQLASEKLSTNMLSAPIFLADGRLAVGSHDHTVYFLKITDKLFPCYP